MEDMDQPLGTEVTPSQEDRIQREVAEFQRSFPQVYGEMQDDLARLPDEVWQMVQEGASLTAAYARHTVAQSKKAPSRSTGSMRSAGNDAIVSDPFMKGFMA